MSVCMCAAYIFQSANNNKKFLIGISTAHGTGRVACHNLMGIDDAASTERIKSFSTWLFLFYPGAPYFVIVLSSNCECKRSPSTRRMEMKIK